MLATFGAEYKTQGAVMRIAILSDLHANLPFGEAAIRRARFHACDRIVHLGDAIDFGPWPAETLDLLLSEGVEMVRGDHDEYPVPGYAPEPGSRFGFDEHAHMEWTASQLRTDQIALLAGLPARIVSRVEEWRVRFQHYVLDQDRVSEARIGDAPQDVARQFGVGPNEILCYGHIHQRLWYFDRNRGILNPGATGFHAGDGAWFAVLVVREAGVWIEWHPVECSSHSVVAELERRGVPAWPSSVHYMLEAAVG
jgi:predicted phosphodiesterase